MRLISDSALAIITIWTEAQGEPEAGKIAVGEVIRNRMKSKFFSDGTIAGTVARRYQFSAWNDDQGDNDLLIRALRLNVEDTKECADAWAWSQTSSLTKGALLYVNLDVAHPAWATPDKFITQIGQHSFYRP